MGKYLLSKTVLRERYNIEKVIGEGNFGITYKGWDKLLEQPVAIKEYFPVDFVSRREASDEKTNVEIFEGKREEEYQKQLGKFLEEAKRLSKFNSLRGVVSVYDFFYQNNTAYIVMEYVSGKSVKSYVEQYGRLDGETVLELVAPVIDALIQIHERGLIHRDISPDNLLISEQRELVLIDFGSARTTVQNPEQSLTIVFKRGFSPEEQYRSHGVQGVWSDVYALCATMYYMLTGDTPVEALERIFEDEMPSLLDMSDISLPNSQKNAIMKGISVRAEERYPSMQELKNALFDVTRRKKQRTVFVGAVVVFFAVGVLGMWKSSLVQEPNYKAACVAGVRKHMKIASVVSYVDELEQRMRQSIAESMQTEEKTIKVLKPIEKKHTKTKRKVKASPKPASTPKPTVGRKSTEFDGMIR